MRRESQQPWKRIHSELKVEEVVFDGKTLSNRFISHAAQTPDKAALIYLGKAITYARLEDASNRFANHLAASGYGEGSVIGAQMPNIPQYAIVFLAASKIGAKVSSISPLYTPPETSYQIQDSQIDVVVALDGFAEQLAKAYDLTDRKPGLTILCSAAEMIGGPESAVDLDNLPRATTFSKFVQSGDPRAVDRVSQPDDIFLLQYTGGTTGRPKGAMLSHININSVLDNGYAYRPFEPDDQVFCPFPFFHIAGASALISSLSAGSTYSVFPNPRDIDHLIDNLEQFPPTIIASVPTLYEGLLAHPKFAQVDFSRLGFAASGAAPLSSDTRGRLEAIIGTNKLTDLFGMTETAAMYCANPPTRPKPDSVGIPIPGADVRIVDVETGDSEMPMGEVGEIIASGPGVMSGYLNLPEETQKALRMFDNQLYMYSGDVGYMDDDGYIYVCDRSKDMLIVGGFKVFSVEIEEKLAQMDEVVLSAVVSTPDQARPGNDIVNLFVQVSDTPQAKGEDALREEITQFCRENMAPYKVPKKIHFIEQIPVTPVGKLDKKKLREVALQMES